MYKKFLASAGAAFLIIAGSVGLGTTAANATYEECVPSEAWTEVIADIEHPAVGEPKLVVENPDYVPATEGTPAIWANFSPNDQKETFVGPPSYPTDERGTWHDHGQLPPGQAGPDGVYANGNPDKGGNWFYRQAAVPGTPAQGEPTIEIDNPDYEPAWTEVVPDIEHPAVTCEEEPEEPTYPTNECTTGVSTHSTNLAPLWNNVDTRSAGHYEYVEGGLHVWTDDNSSQAKVSLGQAANFPLHDTGVISLDWTGSTPPPGVNLFITSEFGNGTLVYESVYGQDLWLTNGSSQGLKDNAPVNGGGNGSQWHGTVDQWLTKIPNAQVVGIAFSLGSGVLGDGVISSITVGCGTHTFDYEREVPEKPDNEVGTDTWEKEPYCADEQLVSETWAQDWYREPVFNQETWAWEYGEKVNTGNAYLVSSSTTPAEECETPVDPVDPVDPVNPGTNNPPMGGDDGIPVNTVDYEELPQTGLADLLRNIIIGTALSLAGIGAVLWGPIRRRLAHN